ncbi:MAG: hypothetical protein KA871_01115 [Cloacibacterium sp.]|nr:hypothetical protein [Cloacibacterium sp.]
MEASKNTLRKMPTDRLIEYLKEDNRYVSRAVEYAFEILQQERGIYFSDEEILRIQNLLQKKTIAEQPSYIKKREQENKNLNIESVTNQSSIFSKNSIIFLSIIFSPLLGGALLFYNLKVLKKSNTKNIIFIFSYLVLSFLFIFLFNILYTNYLQGFISSIFNSDYLNFRYSATTFKIAFKTMINLLFISYLWEIFFGKHFSYQSKDITFPVIICLIIYMAFLFF